MKYIEFKDKIKEFTLFSLSDIRKIEPRFFRARLNEWQKKGYIKKIIKGHYIFSDLNIDEQTLFEIANRIYSPSYVSLETALSFHGLIPESVYAVTSISTLRTQQFKTAAAVFIYRSLKPSLFFGYELTRAGERIFKMAFAEKAVLDYLYLNPQIKDEEDFKSLRLSRDIFVKKVNREKLKDYLKEFPQKAFRRRIKALLDFLNYA